jgi:hypothetical protein
MLRKPSIHAEAGPKFSVVVVGRLHGVTLKRLHAVVEQMGDQLAFGHLRSWISSLWHIRARPPRGIGPPASWPISCGLRDYLQM